ncbi:uncharacterized protein NESG_02391 [Nematocida ausubeli]|uniref:Uncharacterized protein n=1 Tax=Nematocida ausubeli (strain ATCC PRA-371 / ERTm2) TaxID=1913371 RepID=A0A086IZ53_NEMA1|nr:uncharacterized protein NESG_02391 [Nematocida ausubeli]KFG25171.1 hypothetical protein NESG_02391 [Nematocida ausubeli]
MNYFYGQNIQILLLFRADRETKHLEYARTKNTQRVTSIITRYNPNYSLLSSIHIYHPCGRPDYSECTSKSTYIRKKPQNMHIMSIFSSEITILYTTYNYPYTTTQ